jgi:hypothetical protein
MVEFCRRGWVVAGFGMLAVTPTPSATPAFSSKDALGALVTAESFLFGILNVAIGLTASSTFGQSIRLAPRALAHWATLLVTLMATGAALAWVDLFVVGDFPDGLAIVPVVILAVAIVVQPTFALILARHVGRPATPV